MSEFRSFHREVFSHVLCQIRQTRQTTTNFGLHRDLAIAGLPRVSDPFFRERS